MTDAELIERSRWHWRALYLGARSLWRDLHPTDRRAAFIATAVGVLTVIAIAGVWHVLP